MRLKGLIYRELYLMRKNSLLIVFLWFMLSFLGILIRLSILYGNMASMPAKDLEETSPVLFTIFIYLPAFLIMLIPTLTDEVIYADFASKWNIFAYTTPVSEKRYLGAKYIVKAATFIVGFALSLLSASILCALNSRALDGEIMTGLLFLLLAMSIMSFFSSKLAYKYRERSKAQMRGIVAGVILYFLSMGSVAAICVYLDKQGLEADLEKVITTIKNAVSEYCMAVSPFVPFTVIAVLTLSYFRDVKALKRREK